MTALRHHATKNTRILFALFLSTLVSADTGVKQMHVITRHGSRYPLEKQANNLQENTPGTLTPFGQKQLYDLGVWVKQFYNYTGFFNTYVPWKVRMESSAFDRTLVSANSFILGAFDYQARDPYQESLLQFMPANIPVYSTDVENDVYIRAYDKCETFHQRLEQMYSSREWKFLEQQHNGLLTRLAQLDSFVKDADETGKIPLTDLWNVFDSLHVAKTECTVSAAGLEPTCLSLDNPADATALTDAEFLELETLTGTVEQMRYGPERAGKLLGGPLMLKIIDRMKRNLAGQFFLYSAHYPTILGVLSALGEEFQQEGSIPDYASALIFILQEDTETGLQRVQIIFKKDSLASTPPQVVTLRFCANEVTCPLITIEERFMIWNLRDWCRECNNRQADVCMGYLVNEFEEDNFDLDKPFSFGLLIGFGTSAMIACFVCLFCAARDKARRASSTSQIHAGMSVMAPESAGTATVENGEPKDPVIT